MIQIKNKIDFENNLWVGEVDASSANSSKEVRVKFVTDIASITMGRLGFKDLKREVPQPNTWTYEEMVKNSKEQKDINWNRRLNLYNRLLKESVGEPSTPFEFIPVRINYLKVYNFASKNNKQEELNIIFNKIFKYSYLDIKSDSLINCDLLTNMRCLLNAGIKEEDIPFNTPEEVKGFKVIVARTSFKSIVHIDRHRAFVFNEESSRNKKYLNEVEFHYPSWWSNVKQAIYEFSDIGKLYQLKNEVEDKDLKAEDATGELSMRRLVLWGMSAWQQDPNAWDNLFNLRIHPKAQSITRIVVENIKQLIERK